MRKFLSLLAALCVIAVYSSSAFAVKALTEDELDLITAAGEPKVIMISRVSGSNVNISFLDAPSFEVNLAGSTTVGEGSQAQLRALVLNNVAGENQVGTALNIGTAGQGLRGSQSNTIIQSWGSIKDFDSVTLVATVEADAEATVDPTFNAKCVGICNQGNGDANAEANVAALAIALALSVTADQIIEVNDVTGSGSGTVNISILEVGDFQLDIANDAQNSLAAIVVNNVVGRNQVGTAVNIASGTVTVTTPTITLGNTGGSNTQVQSNVVKQYRGTPENFTRGFALGVASNSAIFNDATLNNPSITNNITIEP